MADVIAKKNKDDGMAITLITSSEYKKNSTFDPSAEYIVMQNKKILGCTKTGSSVDTATAKLNDKYFPGLEYSGFLKGKVNAGFWCLQKQIPLGTIKCEKKLPADVAEQTAVRASFSITLNLVDPIKAMKTLIEGTTNLNYSVNSLKAMFSDYIDLVISAYLKKRTEKAGVVLPRLQLNMVSFGSMPYQKSAFETISSVLNKMFTEDIGYSAKVELSL